MQIYSDKFTDHILFRFVINGIYVGNYYKEKYSKKKDNNLVQKIKQNFDLAINNIPQYLYYEG